MKFFLIGDKESVIAFSLAGIDGVVAESETEIREHFHRCMHDPDAYILLITEKLAHLVQPFLNSLLMRKRGPLILEIPDYHGPLARKGPVEDMVLSALGLKV